MTLHILLYFMHMLHSQSVLNETRHKYIYVWIKAIKFIFYCNYNIKVFVERICGHL